MMQMVGLELKTDELVFYQRKGMHQGALHLLSIREVEVFTVGPSQLGVMIKGE